MTLRSATAIIPAPTTTPPPPTSASGPSSFPWSTPSDWDHKTRVYLDEAPGYWQLPACALTPISTIVRDMSKGCGDGGRLTSYACFCTESRRKARWDISTEVAAQCGGGAAASASARARMVAARAVDAGLTTATATATAVAGAARKTAGPGVSGASRPSPQEAVSSALGVFEAYCSIGIAHGIYEPSHEPNTVADVYAFLECFGRSIS
ncbi:hypothetical protein PG985_010557 [Apiospora marii]|uniref:Uncharacterized protein n=1 Tax=Apiospora marii TaxID=335849 RepID=A0ABR1T321_9PEZI